MKDFKIDRQDKPGVDKYRLDVGSIDGDMVLEVTMWDSGNFILTKAQAMEFFGLVEGFNHVSIPKGLTLQDVEDLLGGPGEVDEITMDAAHNRIIEQLKYD